MHAGEFDEDSSECDEELVVEEIDAMAGTLGRLDTHLEDDDVKVAAIELYWQGTEAERFFSL